MFNSLRVGWLATKIGYEIENSTQYVVNVLISLGIHIRTHDTIYIFSQIYCMVTHNPFEKHLLKKGPDYITQLEHRLKYDLKPWLTKATDLPKETNNDEAFEVVLTTELDEHKKNWNEGFLKEGKNNSNTNSGEYTLNNIKNYLIQIGHNVPDDFDLLYPHFEKLDSDNKNLG